MRSLRRRSDFSEVYQEGIKRVGRYLVLFLYPGEDEARAVVASKKIGNAVQRNRAKRLLREAISDKSLGGPGGKARIRQKFFPTRDTVEASEEPAGGLWIVAVARPPILTARSADVSTEVQQLLL